MNTRAEALAGRLTQGAQALAELAGSLDEDQWNSTVPGDGRTVGVVVHHVASVYPIEVQLAQTLAAGEPITGVTMAAIDEMNAEHAAEQSGAGQEETLNLLRENSSAAAAAIAQFTDEQLDCAGSVSLNADAPLTAQFFIEDHALRHSYHHLAKIKEGLSL